MKAHITKGILTVLLALYFIPLMGQAPILIIDLDLNSNSAPAMAASFTNLDAEYDLTTNIPTDLSQYEGVFLCLGIFSSNTVLSSAEATIFVNYLNSGGSLYMEGGDTWYYDPTTALHAMFNILGTEDGTSDLSILNGLNGTFTEGMSFSYSGDNSWIDHISPIAPAFKIFDNQAPAYGTAVAYDAGTYKTIGASFEFGGLQNGTSPSTRDELMAEYLEFLDVSLAPEAAFFAADTIICAMDTVQFFDASSGNALFWDWVFPGGTPAMSTEQNPKVQYQQAGVYNVFLEVSDGEVTSSMLLEEYIHVGSVPATANTPMGISFLCASWGNTTYNTTALAGVSTYQWNIEPTEAGSVSGTGTSATVIWASGFLGTAELSVAGTNYCGTGDFSNPLSIQRYLPDVSLVLPAYVGLPEPAFQLTGGMPTGGDYSGPGVSNGMFDPAIAGLGTHVITYTYTDGNLCTNSAEDSITVTPNVGALDQYVVNGVSVEPNPNSGVFNLRIKSVKNEVAAIYVFNSLGNLVWKVNEANLSDNFEQKIDLNDQPAGLYYIKIEGNSFASFEKIVIR